MAEIIKRIEKTIVTDTNQYASGDFVGTAILTLEDVGWDDGALLQSIVLTDLDKQNQPVDFLFWESALANTTFTNNSALDVHDTDLLDFLGHVPLLAADYSSLSDNSVATVRNIGLTMYPAATTKNLYCTPVSRGTGTYSASGLQVTFTFIRPS